MATTELNLDIQSDKEITSPRFKVDFTLRDDTAIRATTVEWVEPVGANRIITIPDPTVDTEVVLADTPQVLSNKEYSGPTINPTDMVNKGYVDLVAGGVDATAGPGGGVKGNATFDSSLGLDITGGASAIASVKVDGSTITFNGSGQLQSSGGTTATSAPAGGTQGKLTMDENLGLQIVAGIARVKIDGSSILFNGSGQLQSAGAGGATVTGNVATRIGFTRDITAVTAPANVTLGTEIDALGFNKGLGTTGQRYEFTVPDDYATGDLSVRVVYKMSTAVAGPNNVIRLSTKAEIVDVAGGVIDAATYPETQFNFTVPNNSTSLLRQEYTTITAGDFGIGDTIEFYIKRFGGSGFDLHTGNWQVVSFEIIYTSIINTRVAVQQINLVRNAAGETATTPGTLGTQIDTTDFPTGADSGCKVSFIVPDNWDGVSDCLVTLTYAMSTAAVGTVRVNSYGEIANVTTGVVDVLASQNFDLSPPVDTGPHRTTSVRTIPASALKKGSDVTLVTARRVAVGGNHGGSFKLISVLVTFFTAPSGTITAVTITEDYLEQPTFGNQVGLVSADMSYPIFGTNFDALVTMASTSLGGRVDCAFHGRLSSAQTTVAQVRINLLGTGASSQYRLKIYAEGSAGVPVYDSGLTAAPGALTEIVVIAGMWTGAQPITQKRYHVVVEAYIDAGETLLCSMPFVRQE